MKIIVLRHGDAEFRDGDRYLSKKGEEEVNSSADTILSLYTPDLCLSSPKARAMQTASIVLGKMGRKLNPVILPELTPSGDPKSVVSYIDYQAKENSVILVVSHLPLVELLCYELNGRFNMPPSFSTACALSLDYDGVRGKYRHFICPARDLLTF
ncbi:MAG: SixA phosphatase family protein [Succinivibrio sp.]